jgi:hypothetical protein
VAARVSAHPDRPISHYVRAEHTNVSQPLLGDMCELRSGPPLAQKLAPSECRYRLMSGSFSSSSQRTCRLHDSSVHNHTITPVANFMSSK